MRVLPLFFWSNLHYKKGGGGEGLIPSAEWKGNIFTAWGLLQPTAGVRDGVAKRTILLPFRQWLFGLVWQIKSLQVFKESVGFVGLFELRLIYFFQLAWLLQFCQKKIWQPWSEMEGEWEGPRWELLDEWYCLSDPFVSSASLLASPFPLPSPNFFSGPRGQIWKHF